MKLWEVCSCIAMFFEGRRCVWLDFLGVFWWRSRSPQPPATPLRHEAEPHRHKKIVGSLFFFCSAAHFTDENKMAPGKGRTPTAESSNDPPAKRPRLDPAGKDDVQASFRAGLLDPPVRRDLAGSYAKSKPYLHCVIDGLMEDTLLRKVKDEITSSLHFTVKETDIYKVYLKLFFHQPSLFLSHSSFSERYSKQETLPI